MTTSAGRFRCGDVVRIRDEQWRVVRRVSYTDTALIEVAGVDRANRTAHETFLLPFETVDLVESTAIPRVVGRRRWRRVARRVLAEAWPSWHSLCAATTANLRILPFQLEPVLTLVRGDGCRFLIADAVGLGKTIQAGLMIAETLARRPDARILVVSPAALRRQWQQELDVRFRIATDVFDAAGIARRSSALPAGINPWSVPPVILTSIDYIKRPEVARSLEALTWDLVVFDEAHNLAGRSDRSIAASVVGNRARAVVLLTATPHSGDDEAFRRLCDVGGLKQANPLLVFRRTRADVGLASARRDTLLRVRPSSAEAAMHERLMTYARGVWNGSHHPGGDGAKLAMSVLARRACSSATSLARSVERRLDLLGRVASEPDQQIDLPFMAGIPDDQEPGMWLRAPGLPDAHQERGYLATLLDFARQAAAGESKLAALRRLITRTTEPAIVFTEYRDTLGELATALSDVHTAQLHGGLTPRERSEAIECFTRGDARVLLATDAASEGLNLHHRCRLVVNLEIPWTPLRLEQRAGRVDRIGQSRRVHIIHFVAQGTCEESTLEKLGRRITRMQGAMSFGHGPDERRVAESVFGGLPVPEVETAARFGSTDVLLVDHRASARREAQRIAGARALLDPDEQPSAERRAVVVRLPRRRGGPPMRRCLWVFRVTVSDSLGQVIWTPLLTLGADITGSPGRRRHDTLQLVALDHPFFRNTLQVAQDQLLHGLHASLRPSATLWASREQALMTGLRDWHARLSAHLLQRSLFDRRGDRLATEQTVLMDEALAQCVGRVRELDALEGAAVESCRLAFAVVVG